MQIENLCREFDLFKPQAEWFVNGANAILFQKEIQEMRQASQNKDKQREKTELKDNSKKQSVNYVSQLEMMSFLEDIEEMSNNVEFAEFWGELNELKQTVQQQQCATEREVLKIFRIHSLAQRAREEEQRFFDAYRVKLPPRQTIHYLRKYHFARIHCSPFLRGLYNNSDFKSERTYFKRNSLNFKDLSIMKLATSGQ